MCWCWELSPQVLRMLTYSCKIAVDVCIITKKIKQSYFSDVFFDQLDKIQTYLMHKTKTASLLLQLEESASSKNCRSENHLPGASFQVRKQPLNFAISQQTQFNFFPPEQPASSELCQLQAQNYRLIELNMHLLEKHNNIMIALREKLFNVIMLVEEGHALDAVKAIYRILEECRDKRELRVELFPSKPKSTTAQRNNETQTDHQELQFVSNQFHAEWVDERSGVPEFMHMREEFQQKQVHSFSNSSEKSSPHIARPLSDQNIRIYPSKKPEHSEEMLHRCLFSQASLLERLIQSIP